MKVKLLTHTKDPEWICYIASRTCRSKLGPITLWMGIKGLFRKKMKDHIRARIKEGHLSILEHASFTFGIEGISRICSHQLVRHRIGCSYSQQSQRHTVPSGFVLPESMRDMASVDNVMNMMADVHKGLLEMDYSEEDARFILPQASTTNLVVTMNGTSLRHFLDLRLTKHAQKEIRELAGKMLEEVKKVTSVMFEDYEVVQ